MKKKWKFLFGMLTFTMLVTNCKKDEPDGSIEKNKFIQEVIAFTKNEVLIKTPIKVHELEINENKVDFKNLTVVENKYAIAEFKDAGLICSPDEYSIVLYYLEKKTITAANVIKFKSNHTPAFIKANLSEILSFENPEYTGSINITSLYGKFLAEVKLEKGETIATTSLKSEPQKNLTDSGTNLKSLECIAWYLVVTTYYSDGSYTVTSTFLGITCSEGGGGSSSGGGSGGPNGLDKPCFGDPIRNPTIAPTQSGSVYGGMYGCTRIASQPEDINCTNTPYNKMHRGIDIEAPLNSDLYSMYSGIIVGADIVGNSTLGKWVQVQTTNTSGNIIVVQYCHLNEVVLTSGSVSAGTPLAKTGNTGYANIPNTTPHVHIEIYANGDRTDPKTYFGTKFNTNGSVNTPCTY